MAIKGIVWGSTTERAQLKLDEILKQYEDKEILVEDLCRSRQDYVIRFVNKDTWIAVPATENQRARKCNISYIDKEIDDKFVQYIIKPCTSIGPFAAFNYF